MIRTQYFLKKDFYSFIIAKRHHKIIMCNVNERILISNPTGESLISKDVNRVDEHSEGMFSITCCGASVSLKKDMVAVGDFSGNIKIYNPMNGSLLCDTNIGESVRYLHFHDYCNHILFIGTFSGNLFVWNKVGLNEIEAPHLLVKVSKTITSIRNSEGYV
jgi:WD40 repeat protein